MNSVSMEEVAEQYRKALRGDVKIRLDDPAWSWSRAYCGDVCFWIGDWKIAFFNDCDELDYTEFAVAPDGRQSEFDDWCNGDFIGCPLNLLSPDEHDALDRLIEQAA